MNPDKGKLLSIRKPTGIIHVMGGEFSELDHKVLNSAIAFIQRHASANARGSPFTSERVSVPVADFLESIDRVENSYEYFRCEGFL